MSEQERVAPEREEEYLELDFYADDKDNGGLRARSVRIVTTRTEHECRAFSELHLIPRGDRARVEKAVFDGRWTAWYACLPCCERWLTAEDAP